MVRYLSLATLAASLFFSSCSVQAAVSTKVVEKSASEMKLKLFSEEQVSRIVRNAEFDRFCLDKVLEKCELGRLPYSMSTCCRLTEQGWKLLQADLYNEAKKVFGVTTKNQTMDCSGLLLDPSRFKQYLKYAEYRGINQLISDLFNVVLWKQHVEGTYDDDLFTTLWGWGISPGRGMEFLLSLSIAVSGGDAREGALLTMCASTLSDAPVWNPSVMDPSVALATFIEAGAITNKGEASSSGDQSGLLLAVLPFDSDKAPTRLVKYLVKNNALLTIQDEQLRTPLHLYLAQYERCKQAPQSLEPLKILATADVCMQRDSEDENPVLYAKSQEWDEAVNAMREGVIEKEGEAGWKKVTDFVEEYDKDREKDLKNNDDN